MSIISNIIAAAVQELNAERSSTQRQQPTTTTSAAAASGIKIKAESDENRNIKIEESEFTHPASDGNNIDGRRLFGDLTNLISTTFLSSSSTNTRKQNNRSQTYGFFNNFQSGSVIPQQQQRKRRRTNENDDGEVRVPKKRGRPFKNNQNNNNIVAAVDQDISFVAAINGDGRIISETTNNNNNNIQDAAAAEETRKRTRTRGRTNAKLNEPTMIKYDCKIEGIERIFDVSRKLLSEKSAGFKTLFDNCSDNLIEIEGVPDATLELVFKFCHGYSLKECSYKDSFSLLFFSDAWEIPGLKKLIEERVVPRISYSNVVKIANAGISSNSEIIRNECKDFILKYFKATGSNVRNYSNLRQKLRDELDELIKDGGGGNDGDDGHNEEVPHQQQQQPQRFDF